MNDDAAAFRAAAQALNEAGDKELRRETYAGFRRAAKPLGEKVIAGGAAGMPKHGGLSARIAKARMAQANSTSGRNPGVKLSFKVKEGYDLAALDDGRLRHPVFPRPGRKRVWKQQSVPKHSFTKPFEAGAAPVAGEILKSMESVADKIVRESKTEA